MEELSLIDVSLEDDLLISSFSDRHRDLRDPVDVHEGDNQVKMSKQSEHIPEMSESPKQKRPGKVNLRKSLAWDSAFFTSEGVLDTEELAIVNSTFRKTEVCALPGIQEELRQSTESTSTLDTESYTLENLEEDLFANLRHSIQKSLGRQENCTSGEPNESRLGPKKKVELLSQAMMRPPVGLNMDGLSKRRLESTSNGVAKGSGDSKLLSKPPRNLQKSTSLLITSITKDSSGNGANRQGITVFSNTNGESSNIISRSISSNGVSSAPHLAGKSSLEPKMKSCSLRTSDWPLSGSTTLVRALKSNIGASNISCPPTCAKSTFKLSSKASPSSSIDSVVSEASSSTSTLIKPSNSVESHTSSNSSLSLAVPTDTISSEKTDVSKKDVSAKLLQSRTIAKTSLCICTISEPSNRDTRSSTNSITGGTKSFKPSGLRMPSPKIGYFDAERTLVCKSNKFSQTVLRNSDPIGANRPNSSKIPSIRAAAQHESMNFDSTRTQSTPLSSLKDSSHATTNIGIQATYQFHKEEKDGQSSNQDEHTTKEFHYISTKIQKENLSPRMGDQ